MRASRRVIAAIAAIVLAATGARAQDEVSICNSDRLFGVDSALNQALARQAASRGFVVVMDSLRRTFAVQLATDNNTPLRTAFLANMDTATRELDQVLRTGNAEELGARFKSVQSSRMRPTRSGTQRWVLFARGNEGIGLESAALRERYCPMAVAATAVLDAYALPGLQAAAERMQRRAERWRAWHDNSPTLYPWELGFNSVVSTGRNYEPPRGQWLLLHPTVAFEISGSRLKRLDVVTVEWIGYTGNSADLKHSGGLSVISTLSDEQPASIGLLLRWGRSLALGGVVREVDGRRQYGATMSVDLYRIVAKPADEVAALGQLGKK